MTRLTESQQAILDRLSDEGRELVAYVRELEVRDLLGISPADHLLTLQTIGVLIGNLIGCIETLAKKINEGDACQN